MTSACRSVSERGYILNSESHLDSFINELKAKKISESNLRIHLAIPTLTQEKLEDLVDAFRFFLGGSIAQLDIFNGKIVRVATPWVTSLLCVGCEELETVFLTGAEKVELNACPKLTYVGLLKVTELCLKNIPQLQYLEAPQATTCAPLSALCWFANVKILKIPRYEGRINLEQHRQLTYLDAKGASKVSGLRYARSDLKLIPPERKKIPKPRDVYLTIVAIAATVFILIYLTNEVRSGRLSINLAPFLMMGGVAAYVAYQQFVNEIIPSYKRMRY